jgi:hypothetical protein
MGHRIIVPAAQCTVCRSVRSRSGADLYATGYVAGLHKASRGASANENICVMHASVLDEAVARYVGNGVVGG